MLNFLVLPGSVHMVTQMFNIRFLLFMETEMSLCLCLCLQMGFAGIAIGAAMVSYNNFSGQGMYYKN